MELDHLHSSQNIVAKVYNFNIKNHYRCRICLEEDSDVVSLPCGCKEDIGKSHMKCFAKWVQAKTPPMVIPKMTEIKCEICLQTMKIEIMTKKKIRNCSQIRSKNSTCQVLSSIASFFVILSLIYLCIRGIIDCAHNGSIFILYVVYSAAIIFMLIVLKVVIQLTLRIFLKTQIVSLKFVGQNVTHSLQNQNRN